MQSKFKQIVTETYFAFEAKRETIYLQQFEENRTLYLSVGALEFGFTAQSAVPYLLPRECPEVEEEQYKSHSDQALQSKI